MLRGDIKGATVPSSFLASFDAAKPEELKDQIVAQLIGDSIGAATDKLLAREAKTGGARRVVGVLIGAPAFQQQ